MEVYLTKIAGTTHPWYVTGHSHDDFYLVWILFPGSNVTININGVAIYLATGNIRDGMRLIDEALELNPDDSWAWYNKALCLGDQLGKNREALYCLEQCLRIEPNNEQARRAYEICRQRIRGF